MSLFLKQIVLSRIRKRIRSADGDELNQLLHTVIQRHQELFPDWELAVLSLPRRDEEGRSKALTDAISMLQACGIQEPTEALP